MTTVAGHRHHLRFAGRAKDWSAAYLQESTDVLEARLGVTRRYRDIRLK
ncbi:hypothetical protein SS05631_c16610 [Sinorhizobium sp. CCBAU 05631]|nr:hypothetical protein SS05631_c16610 [Sinorhizobium sp. CCBAU 05631]